MDTKNIINYIEQRRKLLNVDIPHEGFLVKQMQEHKSKRSRWQAACILLYSANVAAREIAVIVGVKTNQVTLTTFQWRRFGMQIFERPGKGAGGKVEAFRQIAAQERSLLESTAADSNSRHKKNASALLLLLDEMPYKQIVAETSVTPNMLHYLCKRIVSLGSVANYFSAQRQPRKPPKKTLVRHEKKNSTPDEKKQILRDAKIARRSQKNPQKSFVSYIDASICEKIVASNEKSPVRRDAEIICLKHIGATNREIARRVFCDESTVERVVARYKKSGMSGLFSAEILNSNAINECE